MLPFSSQIARADEQIARARVDELEQIDDHNIPVGWIRAQLVIQQLVTRCPNCRITSFVLSQLAMQVAAAVQIAPQRRTVGNIELSNPTYKS